MVDIPGNSTTTASVTVGSTTFNSLETLGDHDWFRITLTVGQEITVALNGFGINALEDAYLRIRDSAGNLLYENDDGGPGLNSLLSFGATYTGTYFIDVGAWDNLDDGDYQLVVTNYVPPPVGTYDQLAQQLVSGYWDGFTQRFNVSQGGTITVTITGLTSAGQTLAREALALWSDIIGVTFQEVTTGGQITFDDNEDDAWADFVVSGDFITSAQVNVSTQWLATYGTTLNSYSFHTYVHEIGHALGLGHAGNYNDTARHPYDALFQIDGWPASVMSYFDQVDSAYYADRSFSEVFVVTPMIADIVAMSSLYGLSTNTRLGDTVYGFNSNAGRAVLNASVHPNVGYTIFDSGGTDTLDYSGFSQNQRINLNAETFSNVGGLIGNVAIARGVMIENAIGGSGVDEIIGNAGSNTITGGAGADILTGGPGADIFRDSTSGLNGDWITDFSIGDRIIFTNASLATFTFSLTGSTLTYSGGSLTFTGNVGQLSASAAAGGGVQLMLSAAVVDARHDFNGDGRSDILWRSDAGQLSNWLGTASGGWANNDANAFIGVPNDWHVVGIADFNGDGRDDLLWRSDSGHLSNWLGTASGGWANNDANAFTGVSTDWTVAGTGDFNGDGRDDILWRSDTGELSNWLGTASGGFANNDANAFTGVSTDWNVAAVGDFNGDGRDDILWRSDSGHLSNWLGTASGGWANNDANAFIGVPTDWHVVGTGDFNGDGRDDLLWRSDSGHLSNWLGQANGGFAPNDANAFTGVSGDWHVAQIGDFNGDGRDDILWRSDAGHLSNWLGTATGGFANNDANAFAGVSTDWNVQSPDLLWV